MGFSAVGSDTALKVARPVIEWEEPHCLLCGSFRGSLLLEAADPVPQGPGLWFAVTQCQDCGLCFTNPRPAAASLRQFYAAAATPRRRYGLRSRALRPRWLPRASRWHDVFCRIPHQGERRLLDFGCGSGGFLRRMQERGWEVMGVDSSESKVQRIRGEWRLPALVGSLPHSEIGEHSFDVITMRHSLEHVSQPLEVLKAAYRALAPGGKLVVAVPNIDSLPFKWFGRYWRGLDLPRHLTHFTPDTLHLMLARAGFEPGPVRMLRQPHALQRSARLAERNGGHTGWRVWLGVWPFAALATWYAYLARRCDAMLVTAVKGICPPSESEASFSRHEPDHPRWPGGRWHNR
jgi:2-polyprenyl-3-methyl-5-hydroxy-6-metoxy-1,4-benzoquinol methylase